MDDLGRLTELDQLGWQVEFLRHVRAGDLELPDKVFATRGTGDEALSVRLLIKNWTLPEDAGAHQATSGRPDAAG